MRRFSASNAANLAAWAVVAGLIAASVVVVTVMNFLGLLILGLATCLVCTLAELNQDSATWGPEVFRARMEQRSSPEQRAAMHDETRNFISPLRYYRNCGLLIAAIGGVGLALQIWR